MLYRTPLTIRLANATVSKTGPARVNASFTSQRYLATTPASAKGTIVEPSPTPRLPGEPVTTQNLTWPEYFRIRKNKRTWEVATTIPSSLFGLGAGFAYFGSLDGSSLVMGIDPMFVYGLATLSCGGLGWLFGPFIGGTFWRMSHRKALALIEERERTFHHHIVKNRADPSRQSAMNPVPDFYGEKVGSLSQYRQWLRDQGKYKRKAMWSEELEQQ